MTAADAHRWAGQVGALDGIRRSVAEAAPLPEAAADLLRHLGFPVVRRAENDGA